jgi:glutathione peroxidase
MFRINTFCLLLLSCCVILFLDPVNGEPQAVKKKDPIAPQALAFEVNSLEGKKINLAKKYQDKVVMIVNVASECGLTPQYKQLQSLHQKYSKQGLAVLGFPCNQFGKQEPGSSQEIQAFCKKNYGVKFDMFEKVEVNGQNASGLYNYLTKLETKPKGAGKISWNFEKFLIDRSGNVIARFTPQTKPNDPEVIERIEAAL